MTNTAQKSTNFSEIWWLIFQEKWNQQDKISQKLAGLGRVIFQFSDGIGLSVCLNWDDKGKIIEVKSAEKIEPSVPVFSATSENWHRFVKKEIGAARAVMSGMIKYTGPITLLLKYGRHFDLLADVAQTIQY